MSDPELFKFINVLRARIDAVENEWEQWKTVASIVPRSDSLWNQPVSEWICLGRLRCSQSVLPLSLDNSEIELGNSSDPFTSLHVNQNIYYQDDLYVRSDRNNHRVAWHVDPLGCQSWGTAATHQQAQFSMVGRGSFTLHDVEVGLQWIRIYFPEKVPIEKRDICLFLRPGDKIELEGIERLVEQVMEPDRVKLNEQWPEEIWEDWMRDNKFKTTIVRNIRVFPMWARAYLQGSDAKPFWSITNDGRILYKCDKLPESEKFEENILEWDLIINGSAWLGGPLQVNGSVSMDRLYVKNKKLVKNLNAEYINGFSAPREGELVSTRDRQEIIRKKWGDALDMQGNVITSLGPPRGDNDAIPKWYMEQWLLGMHTRAPVRAVTLTELPEDAKWFPEEHAWKSQTKRTLINVDLRKCLDGVDLHRGDSILIRCQPDVYTNGIFMIEQEGDGEKNGWIFRRRQDFTPGQSCEIKHLRGTYVWCSHGKENARSGWTLLTRPDFPAFWWQEGDFAIEFELFQQAGSFSREFGNGLQQIGGKVQLRVSDDVFEVTSGQLRLREKSIQPLEHLAIDYIDMIGGPGLKVVSSPRIHLGNRCQFDLLCNPSHFDFNASGELCLADPPMSGFHLDSSKTLRFHYSHLTSHPVYFSKSVEWVQEIEPPREFHVSYRCIRGQENNEENQTENLWVQYWIAGITREGLLTTAISSAIGYETLDVGSGTRWMSKLEWKPIQDISHFRIWRCTSRNPIEEKINLEYQLWEELDVDVNTTQLLDVIWPIGFQKLEWINREFSLPQENQTRKTIAKIGTDNGIQFLQTPMSIGSLQSEAGILHLEGSESDQPAIHIKIHGDTNDLPHIQWDLSSSKHREEWNMEDGKVSCEIGKDIIYRTMKEEGRFVIAPQEWNGSEFGDERFQVLQGGARVEGGIINQGPEGYMTEGTGLQGNPALIRTGAPKSHFQRSLGNGVFFSWRGSQLEAIPAIDGKPSETSLPIKQFTIDHPTKENHWLQYACLEGPTADAFLRGSVHPYSSDPFIRVKLPEYWDQLVYVEEQTVTLTPKGGPAVGLWYDCEGNMLTIHWEKFTGTRIDYLIIGQRRGTEFNCEPKKSDVHVSRWGPYTFNN